MTSSLATPFPRGRAGKENDVNLLPANCLNERKMIGAWDINSVQHLDAIKFMRGIPSQSISAYITDIPYGTTSCSWDEIIPFAPMWAEVKRTLKPRGVFVTTASQPFTSKLVMSNVGMFRYEWIWDKVRPSGFQYAQYRPMMQHENILVFSEGSHNYYPQKVKRNKPVRYRGYGTSQSNPIGARDEIQRWSTEVSPLTILAYVEARSVAVHPTQKPVALYEYLISTYTQAGDLVVDFCCGSGTTLLAARNLNRDYMGCDITPEYVEVSKRRLAQPWTPLLFSELAG